MTALLEAVNYGSWILHALIWLPLVGATGVLALPRERAKTVSFWWSAALFVLSLAIFDDIGAILVMGIASKRYGVQPILCSPSQQ